MFELRFSVLLIALITFDAIISRYSCHGKSDFWTVGCFKDPGNDFDGDAFAEGDMKYETCVSACMERNFKYMGLQASASGDEATCRCGNSFGKSGMLDACSYSCPGNSKQKCGGPGVNTVLYGFIVVEPEPGLADTLALLVSLSLMMLTLVMTIGTIILIRKTYMRY